MTVAGSLMLGALAVGWVSPIALRPLTARGCDAPAAIIAWLATIAGVIGTFAAGAGLLLLPGDRPAGGLADLAHECWAVARHGRLPGLDELVGAVGAAVLAGLLVRFLFVAVTSMRARRRVRRAHLDLMRITEPARDGGVLWLDHTAPYAYSLSGRPGLIVASTGLRRLPAAQVAAVLRHERAHLRGQHHLLVALTQDLATAVPFVPLFRDAPAVRQLVELAADATAARACGRPAVRTALRALDAGPHPRQALAMAEHDVPLRLRRLAGPVPVGGLPRRATTRVTALLASAVTPAAVGVGTLLLALAVACPA
jgi:Zn-dependent protease with chaperone function